MKIKCKICDKHTLTYKEKMSLVPQPYQFQVPKIECAGCKGELAATESARIIFVLTLIPSLICSIFILAKLLPNISYITVTATLLTIIALFYFAIWPTIITLKEWEPFKYWVPKNRIVGYSLYLLIPLSIVAGLFSLAVYFEWGM